jgi:hypothetical protein
VHVRRPYRNCLITDPQRLPPPPSTSAASTDIPGVTELRVPPLTSSGAIGEAKPANMGEPPRTALASAHRSPARRWAALPRPQMMPPVLAAARALRVPPGRAFGPPLPRPATARDGRLRGRAAPGHHLTARDCQGGWEGSADVHQRTFPQVKGMCGRRGTRVDDHERRRLATMVAPS